jgi:hypothetical protein
MEAFFFGKGFKGFFGNSDKGRRELYITKKEKRIFKT